MQETAFFPCGATSLKKELAGKRRLSFCPALLAHKLIRRCDLVETRRLIDVRHTHKMAKLWVLVALPLLLGQVAKKDPNWPKFSCWQHVPPAERAACVHTYNSHYHTSLLKHDLVASFDNVFPEDLFQERVTCGLTTGPALLAHKEVGDLQ